MEQRRVYGKNHWYHETQSTNSPVEILPLVPEAADVDDRFCSICHSQPISATLMKAGWRPRVS